MVKSQNTSNIWTNLKRAMKQLQEIFHFQNDFINVFLYWHFWTCFLSLTSCHRTLSCFLKTVILQWCCLSGALPFQWKSKTLCIYLALKHCLALLVSCIFVPFLGLIQTFFIISLSQARRRTATKEDLLYAGLPSGRDTPLYSVEEIEEPSEADQTIILPDRNANLKVEKIIKLVLTPFQFLVFSLLKMLFLSLSFYIIDFVSCNSGHALSFVKCFKQLFHFVSNYFIFWYRMYL